MKNGWPAKRLDELFVFKNGRAFKKQEWSSKGLPIIRIQNLNSEDASFNYFAGEYSQDILVEPGDLLFSWSGTVGSSFGSHMWNGKTGVLNQHIFKIGLHEMIAKRYAFYGLRHITEKIEQSVNGAVGLVHITKEKLNKFTLSVPPLTEQLRIVEILDEALADMATAKANAEKNLQNARAIFTSHLQSILLDKKWKWKTIGDLSRDVEYGSSAKSRKDGKIPVLRMGNIQDRKLDWENLAYTDDDEEIEKYRLKHNDVLFNRTNSPELVGKTAIYKSEMPAIFAGYLIRINRKEDLLDADYLNYFLNSQIAFDHGKTVVISSVNQANINGAKLKSYPIPAPTLAEQKQIVTRLDSLSAETQRLEKIYERKLAALEALKKSLLHQAFTDQLTKRTPQPVVVQPLLPPIPNFTPNELHAGILAMGYQAWEQANRQWNFGHVMAEKFSHMTEALTGLDLGREPVQDHFGPDDHNHFKKVEHRARMANYFTFQDGKKGKVFVKGRRFDDLAAKTRAALGEFNQKLDAVIKLMLPLDMQQAEVVATVYAAWNNLLMDKMTPTDEQIVQAARENWHADKLKIRRENFFKTIAWIRKKNICPEGKGKRVTVKAA